MANVCASLDVTSGCTEGTTKCDTSTGHRLECQSNSWVDQGVDSTCGTPTSKPTITSVVSVPPSPPTTNTAPQIVVTIQAGASGYPAGLVMQLVANGTVIGTSNPFPEILANQQGNVTWTISGGYNTAGVYHMCAQWQDDAASQLCIDVTVTGTTPGCTEGATQCGTNGHNQKCVGGAWVDQGTCTGCPGGCTPGQVTCDGTTQYTCNTDGCGKTNNGVTQYCGAACSNGATRCNGFIQQTCQNNQWVDQGCSPTCGATCNNGETKCVGTDKYLCQSCTYTNQGCDTSCGCAPPCAGITIFGRCIDPTLLAVTSILGLGMIGGFVMMKKPNQYKRKY